MANRKSLKSVIAAIKPQEVEPARARTYEESAKLEAHLRQKPEAWQVKQRAILDRAIARLDANPNVRKVV